MSAHAQPATHQAHGTRDLPRSRIAALDLLRGIAILGTLGTNIWLFTDPSGPWAALAPSPGFASAGAAVESGLRFLADGKALALLTVLFGVGLELQYRSALRTGAVWPGRYLWRTTLLLLEGTLHYLLIFEFDVLMGYALVAFRMAYLVRRTEHRLRRTILIAGAGYLVVLAALTATLYLTPESGPAPVTDLYAEGSWLEQVEQRVLQAPVFRAELALIVPSGIVLFGAGILLVRGGAFELSPRGIELRRKLITYGLGIGLPANLVTTIVGGDLALLDRYLLPPLVALGILGLVTELLGRSHTRQRWLGGAVGDLGRAALSGYVLQNLLAAALCYGWGLGLATRLSWARPWWVIGAWLILSALQLALARWWMRHHRRGPLESLWHWATEAPGRVRPWRQVRA